MRWAAGVTKQMGLLIASNNPPGEALLQALLCKFKVSLCSTKTHTMIKACRFKPRPFSLA